MKLISVIVPTYNEELGIKEFYSRTKNVLLEMAGRFKHEIIFIDDSSSDNTYQILEKLAQEDSTVRVINFSRNFGNQMGISAGLDFAKGDIAIIIDDDLQDPPELMHKFIEKWDEGYKVVYGYRPKRMGINPLFNIVAGAYYKLISALSEVDIPRHAGDYRLLDRVVMEALKNMREGGRYYRGMVSWAGYSQIGVKYTRDPRYAGKSTFTLKKYLKFAISGLTSFSEKPLYVASIFGFLMTTISFIVVLSIIVYKLVNPSFSVPGWVSLIIIITIFGGIQLISIGIIGVYVGHIYREVKCRPKYLIDKSINMDLS